MAPWRVALWSREAVEPALFRAPAVIILFLLLWSIVLWILEKQRIPYQNVIGTKSMVGVYSLLGLVAFLALQYIFVFGGLTSIGWSIEFAVLPMNWFLDYRTGLSRYIRLCFLSNGPISFSEVLFADGLTSLSKVFKDIGTSFVLFSSVFTLHEAYEYHSQAMLLLAVLASLPYFIRARQCWVQLNHVDASARFPIWLNFGKYLSAFPPIWLATAASLGYSYPNMHIHVTNAAYFNTFYSFIWDISMDWGLISPTRDGRIFIRPRVLYPAYWYAIAVPLNLLLRLSWTMNHWPGFSNIDSTTQILIVEIGEVFRRAMWMIFRIEWEIVNTTNLANGIVNSPLVDNSKAEL